MEVFGVPQEKLLALLRTLGRVDPVGQAFPVYKVGASTCAAAARVEDRPRPQGLCRRRRSVDVVRRSSTAAHFTINAIGWDPLTDEYRDPFHGRNDLQLRVLRIVDPATFPEIPSVSSVPCSLPRGSSSRSIPPPRRCARRSRSTICRRSASGVSSKAALQAERPSIGFALARELGVVRQILPEMEPLYDCPQDPEWHPEGNVWIHTLMVIDEARKLNSDLDRPRLATVMLGAVCHDLGKPATTALIDGRVRSPNHEAEGVGPATRILDRLNVRTLDNFDVRAQVLGLVAEHLRPSAFYKAKDTVTDGAFRRLAQKVDLELLVASRARIAMGGPERSTVRRWIGLSIVRARWASSTNRRRRSCWDAT